MEIASGERMTMSLLKALFGSGEDKVVPDRPLPKSAPGYCRNCKYFHPVAESSVTLAYNECWRFPPHPDDSCSVTSSHPCVEPDQYCGEWKLK